VVAELADAARAGGADRLEVMITSPGRQAGNGDELLAALASAARSPARILSAAEEGRLAFVGALEASSESSRRVVAVLDVGGGSAQVVVGSRRTGPVWLRSLDLGSLRLTGRMLSGDPPGAIAVAGAHAEVRRYLDGFDPPEPQAAIAVGGSARALRRIAGARLDAASLDDLVDRLGRTPTGELIARYGLRPHRARTLTAGAIILSELTRRLRTPFKVGRAGLREGALAELAERRAAA
jgi:exopolyphosphatase/guanosine-5'-triphosphate,3'-diphosphate pyrophosphatase